MSENAQIPSKCLYIRNIPDNTRPEELRSMFGKFGRIEDVYIPLDHYNRKPRGFAYVGFLDLRSAEDALNSLNCTRFYGRVLEVEFAQGHRKTPAEMKAKESAGRAQSRAPIYSNEWFARRGIVQRASLDRMSILRRFVEARRPRRRPR